MFSFLFFAALCVSCLAGPKSVPKYYSFSPSVGGGSGRSLPTTKISGRITAIRVWEVGHNYITGIQLRFGKVWAVRFGRPYGPVQEMQLFPGEAIVQVSGKYHSNYIFQLIFVTSMGRSLIVGRPIYSSFNFYAAHPNAELLLLSGRFNGAGITSIAAHWGAIGPKHKKHK